MMLPACQDEPQPFDRPSPLTATPQRLQFDQIPYGDNATKEWVLHNISDEPVTIKRIGPFSCQCVYANLTLPQRNNQSIAIRGDILNIQLQPNETAVIAFTLDTARYRKPVSRKLGSIPVVLADHPGMVLEWAADIFTPFVVSPWAIELGDIGIRQRAIGRAMVTAHDSNEFILDVDGYYNDWHVKSNPVFLAESPRSTYELIFTAPDELAEGPFREEFEFFTNLPNAPSVRINVQGVARPDLFLRPQRLMFDPSRKKTSQEFAVIQTAHGQIAPEIDLSQFENHGLKVEKIPSNSPQIGLYKVSCSDDVSADGSNDILNFESGYELQPQLQLSFTILPKR